MRRRDLKKTLAVILSATLMFPSVTVQANTIPVESEIITNSYKLMGDGTGGYVPEGFTASAADDSLTVKDIHNLIHGEKEDIITGKANNERLRTYPSQVISDTEVESAYPAAYNNTDAIDSYLQTWVMPTRNQNPYGSCWAHAAVSLAELYAIKQYGADRNKVDYSERALAYYSFAGGTNPDVEKGGSEVDGDSIVVTSGLPTNYLECTILNLGGSIPLATGALARWRGLQNEGKAQYSNDTNETIQNRSFSEVNWSENEYSDDVRLEDCYALNLSNTELVKKFIKAYGGAAISYYTAGNMSATTDSDYYNAANSSFYCDYSGSALSPNHAVTIIGWDDNYPSTNFNAEHRPAGNGAWLVRNSWKVNTSPSIKNGQSYFEYFWMSYENKIMNPNAYVFKLQEQDSQEWEDHNYYYNGQYYDIGNYCYNGARTEAANVYTAGSREAITSVSFSLFVPALDENTAYTVKVYKGLDGTDPITGGTLAEVKTGHTPVNGYYTIDLDEPVIVEKDMKFSIVISFNQNAVAPDIEYPIQQGAGTYNQGPVLEFYAKSGAAGQSFLRQYSAANTYSWIDGYSCYPAGESYGGFNYIIGAQTKDVYTVTYETNNGTDIDASYVVRNDSLTAPDAPEREHYTFVGWYSDSELTDPYNFNSKVSQNLTLYAKWKPVPYSISYNLDGGSVSVNNPVSYDISSNSFTLQNPERDGYEFVGWTGTDISSETENVTIPQGSYGDREYVAVWHKLADSVTVSPDDCEVPQGSTCKLTAEVSPKEAYNKSVKWTSSDTCIAKVSDLGVVTAVSQGTAVITATAADGSSKQGTCSVTVVKPAAAVTAAPVAGTLIYSGDAQPLVSEGEVTGGIMNYALADGKVTKLPSGAKFGADIPTAAAVGAYTVFYKAVGDSDHTDSQYAFVHAAIGKAVPKYDPPVNKTIACGQTLQDIDLPDGFAIENNQTEPEIGESKTIRLTYTPSDTANFETVAGIEITVKAQHALSETKAVTSTCTEKGNDAYWTCSRCGKYFSDAEGKTEIAANAWVTDSVGHQYGTPVYIWSEDGKSCTASVTCKRNAKHIVTENAVVTSKVTTAPTCKEKGITTYTAVFQNTLFTEQTKAISDVPKSATHTQNDAVKENENASTCDTEGSYDMVVYCSVCGEELTRKTVTVKKHKLAKIEAIEPSCENTGNGTYWKCSVCGRCFSDEEGDNELNDNSWVKDALGHDYGTPEYKWSDDGKTCTATLICMREGCNEGIKGHKISQDAVITSVIKEKATIDKMGTTTYSATFNNTLFATQTKDVVDIPKLEKVIDNPADNPGNDPADNPGNDPTDKSSTDKKQDTTTENPADVTPDKPQDQSTDKQTMPVETPTTPVVKEDGTILPVTEVKAEVVVTSKAGETPAVTYKGTTDDTAKVVEIPSTVIDSGVSYMVTEIAEDAFKDNTIIESVVISKNIETIGENAFSGCSNLKKVIIPESVTEISDGAFEGCIGLKTVELPKSVAKIGNKAFAGCTSLTNITIPAKVNKLGKDSFKGTKRLKILIVKTKKLTGKSVRNALKGSKIKIIRVNVGNKKLNKKYVKKYKKIFTKKNVGVKVVVR